MEPTDQQGKQLGAGAVFKKFSGGMSLGILALAAIVIMVLQIVTADMGTTATLLSYTATTLLIIGLIRISKTEEK
ncbi:hypothetical protein [Corynebacterium gallinarum]|uniref:Uncharacterized protein n=1 Tax=Corynebacterium gallinarum TaxID=2762214 RepID=A0A8I0LAJ1_9CORY|nr:hypothetical protein [Corynebacterium gallinarum]MBD8029792.1 hypothetical protein [Corynebacterium gallinarum]